LGKSENSFYFYHLEGSSVYLKTLFQALPSMPLCYLENSVWKDLVPQQFFNPWLQQIYCDLKSLFHHSVNKNAQYRFSSDICIEGEISPNLSKTAIKTKIVLDAYTKFSLVEVGAIQMRVIRAENQHNTHIGGVS